MSAPITPVVFGVALMSGGIAQLIAGVIQFRTAYTYAGVLSSAFCAFWLSLYGIAEFSLKGIPAGHAGQVLGLFLYAFVIFTVIMLIASFRTNVVIVVALADLVATFFVLGAGNYYGSGLTVETGGYLGLAAALAANIALAELCEAAYKRVVVPHTSRWTVTARATAAMTAGKVTLATAGVVITPAWWQAGIKQSRRSGMIRTHSYDVTVAWTGNQGSGTSGYREYGRDHEVAVSGDEAGDAGRPQPIAGSSDSAFRGDPGRWNPEQLFTAALAQCHMLSYLHACAAAGIVVTGYADEAHGTMTETTDGGGHFIEVVLRPQVTVASPDMVQKAARLHREAHEKCFIASSVNFPVRHEPVVRAASTAGQRD